MGASVVLHGVNVWIIAVLAIVGVAILGMTAGMVIPVHPSSLVSPREKPVGTWSAQCRAISLDEVVKRHPNMGDYVVLLGHITFHPDGTIEWEVGSLNRRSYGALKRQWTPPYVVSARRLKGMGHQVHVAIRTGQDPESEFDVDDLWLYHAENFPI